MESRSRKVLGTVGSLNIALALVFAVTAPTAAEVEAQSGRLWYDRCSQPDLTSQLACTSFIFGVNEVNTLLRLHNKLHLYCPPETSTIAQLRGTVMRYLDRHPEDLDKAFVVLVLESLREAFPCAEKI